MKIPKLSKMEWYAIAGIAVVTIIATTKLIQAAKTDPNAPADAESEFKKDAATAIGATTGFMFLNRALPMLLSRLGLGAVGFTSLVGWPLWLAAGGVFTAFGGYEMVQSAFPFLPRIGGNCPPGTVRLNSGYCAKVEIADIATDTPLPAGSGFVAPGENADNVWQTGGFNA